MSVVGLTLGIGAKATRPSAARAASVATSAITFAEGFARSYHAKPAPSARKSRVNDASCQAMGGGASGGGTGCGSGSRRDLDGHTAAQQLRALLGQERRAGAAQHAGGLGGEVPAAGEHVGGRAVGDRPALGQE